MCGEEETTVCRIFSWDFEAIFEVVFADAARFGATCTQGADGRMFRRHSLINRFVEFEPHSPVVVSAGTISRWL